VPHDLAADEVLGESNDAVKAAARRRTITTRVLMGT
jgi:hypothetical protein